MTETKKKKNKKFRKEQASYKKKEQKPLEERLKELQDHFNKNYRC